MIEMKEFSYFQNTGMSRARSIPGATMAQVGLETAPFVSRPLDE
jgi:hypothetical protein